MKRKGFTLAEVLIALSIVGIIAALTIPNMVTSYKKSVFGSSLAVAVSNFETAMQGMIIKEGVDDLYNTRAWKSLEGSELSKTNINTWATFVSELLSFVKIHSEMSDCYGSNKIKSFDSQPINHINFGYGIQLKSGTVYWLMIDSNASKGTSADNLSEEVAFNRGTTLQALAATLVIDINGDKKPNTIGRDLFFFYLGSNGKLYPAGGKDYEAYKGGGNHTWNEQASSSKCLDNDVALPGLGCTARLVENGFKMDY